jgi:hypothetical protein
LPRNKGNPHCPACGSSATLPFEDEENAWNGPAFSEIILLVLLLFLLLFSILLLLLLSHAGLPIGISLILVIFLIWRRQREVRRARLRPRQFVCLDCSHNFKA